jgi:hypothetical protein
MSTWSALIAPAPTWDTDANWDPDAQKIQGISRWQTRQGASPQQVMQTLNVRCKGVGVVWCDGGHYAACWLRTLAEAAGVEPAFSLADISTLFKPVSAQHQRYVGDLNVTKAPHRAGPDAARIGAALLVAFAPS